MSSFFEKEFTTDRVWRIFFRALVFALLAFFVFYIKGSLYPFIIGWLIASISMPIVRFFQYKLKLRNRIIAIFATILSFWAFMALLAFLFVPPTIAEFHKASDMLTKFEGKMMSYDKLPPQAKEYIAHFIDVNEFQKMFDSQHIYEYVKKYVPKLMDVASQAARKLFNLMDVVLVMLYGFFIMLYYEPMVDGFFQLIPEQWRKQTQQVFRDLADNTARYFRGQSLVAAIVGVLFSIGFLIIGLPLAIPLGLFIGLLNMIPYAQIIGILPAALLCLLHSVFTDTPFLKLFSMAMLVFIVVQLIQDTIITPKIMGKVTGFNPAIILLCLSIGGTLFGVIGVVMALPISTMLLTYYHHYILKDESPGDDISKK